MLILLWYYYYSSCLLVSSALLLEFSWSSLSESLLILWLMDDIMWGFDIGLLNFLLPWLLLSRVNLYRPRLVGGCLIVNFFELDIACWLFAREGLRIRLSVRYDDLIRQLVVSPRLLLSSSSLSNSSSSWLSSSDDDELPYWIVLIGTSRLMMRSTGALLAIWWC